MKNRIARKISTSDRKYRGSTEKRAWKIFLRNFVKAMKRINNPIRRNR